MNHRLLILASGSILVAAQASATLNVPVASRVVGFTQPAPLGAVVAAVVFEPGNAASEAEAVAIEQQIGSGLVAGRATIRARRVPTSALAGLSGVRVAFVTAGLRAAAQAQVAEAATRASILTVTSDLACVQAGRCVVSVTGGSQPKITVSRSAARSAGIRFGSAFLMLVKEL